MVEGQETDGPRRQNSVLRRADSTYSVANAAFNDKSSNQDPEAKAICRWALRLVRRTEFSAAIGILIGLNSVLLGVETDHPHPKEMWQGIEIGFTVAFISELILRLLAYGGAFFQDLWCLFDSCLIGVSLIDLVVSSSNSEGSGSLQHFTVLRILRLLRLVRAVRLIRMLRPLYLLLQGLIDNATALMWVGLLIIVVVYTFAVFLTRMIGQHSLFDGTDIQEKFSTVLSSMFSLFVLMTFEDWYNSFIIPVIGLSPVIVLVFMLFLMLTSFSVLNILCGLFVSSTMLAAENQASETLTQASAKRKARLQKLKEVFKIGDVNHDGVMTVQEFQDFTKIPKVANALKLLGIRAKDACELFKLLDSDGNASLKVSEFMAGCARLCDNASGRDIVLSHYALAQQIFNIQGEFASHREKAESLWEESCNRLDAVDACVERISAVYRGCQPLEKDDQKVEDDYRRVRQLCSVLDGALCSRVARAVGPKDAHSESDTLAIGTETQIT